MPPELLAALVGGGALLCMLVATLVVLARCMVRVGPHEALVVNTPRGARVHFDNTLVMPIVHHAARFDLTPQTVVIEHAGKEGLVCRDGIRADIRAAFRVSVPRNAESVLLVAQSLGPTRAGDPETLTTLFGAKFSDALQTVARQLDFVELVDQRDHFRDGVVSSIGADLNGFHLDDLVLQHLEQTPVHMLDPNNLLDATGIAKIAAQTAEAQGRQYAEQQRVRREMARLEAEVRAALLDIERHEAEALARFQADTGRAVSREQLQRQLEAKLEALSVARLRGR